MKLVFATHNSHKFEEIKSLIPHHVELLSLGDIGCTEDIPETAETIDENAMLKANYVREHYNYDCFADDTGLEVDALDGAPGVYSARYAGGQKDNEANITKLLEELEGETNRKARFKTVIALNMEHHENLFTGICEGKITTERQGDKGFGYDSVFLPEAYQKTFAQMSLSEKSTISHRGRAIRQLIEYLSE